MNKKIIVRIIGGIGNQLFCYSAARRLSIVNNAELVVDNVSGFERDTQYKRRYQLDRFNLSCRKANNAELLHPFSRVRRYVLRTINGYRDFYKRSYIRQNGYLFEERLLDFRVKKNLFLEGYWQSEHYFKDVESIIRSDLRIIPPMDATNQNIAQMIHNSASVAVHVRFFDTPNGCGGNNIPPEYYDIAIKQIEQSVPNAHYFLFSDQPAAAQSIIPVSESKVTCVSHNSGDDNAWADLWLMSQCKHFIIANSTFSWWAAWLSENKGKIVLSPEFSTPNIITAWNFEKLIPENWITIKI